MWPELFGIAWVVAAVFALLVALPVLRDVAVDGLAHHRRMRSREDESSSDPQPDEARSTSIEDGDARDREDAGECRHCGAANDAEFRYCRRCGERL